MEYNRYRDSSGKVHRSRKSDNILFNFQKKRQKDSSQSHQNNGITLYDQQEHTKCRLFRSHSGAIQFIELVDTAIFTMIPKGDTDLTTYLIELLRTNKPDQQNYTFWFPTP